jgi:glutamate carboxypeptidase
MHARTVFLLIVWFTAPVAWADGLSTAEQQLVTSIDAAVPRGLDLLERSVNMNSGTMNFEGVRQVGALFRAEFDALGFTTRWVDGAAWNRAGHLIAEHRAGTGPHLLLIGHLDTVFEPDSPFQKYERISEDTATGPGTTDMKGGDVIMLLALGALKEAGALNTMSVTVVLTGDEERAGSPTALSRRDLIEAAEKADIAIGFEDGDGDPRTAVVARRGASGWSLKTRGKPAHSSLVFREDIGSGAIYEAARILAAFHDSLGGEDYLTFNPGVILGGTTVSFGPAESRGTAFGKSNVIAESTLVAGDLRALSLEQRENAKLAMQRIVSRHYPHTQAEITFSDGYPPLAPSEGNLELLAMFDRASRDLGFGPVEPVDPARAGAADVSFTAGYVDMAMDGVGLMGDGGHTVHETADLRTLPIQAKRVAVLLWRLAHR